jgi:hypothetical protein
MTSIYTTRFLMMTAGLAAVSIPVLAWIASDHNDSVARQVPATAQTENHTTATTRRAAVPGMAQGTATQGGYTGTQLSSAPSGAAAREGSRPNTDDAGKDAATANHPFEPTTRQDSAHVTITNRGNNIIVDYGSNTYTPDDNYDYSNAQPATVNDDIQADAVTATPVENVPTGDEMVWINSNCPNELQPGSTQADADTMEQLYGCSYRSACYMNQGPETSTCTYYFMSFSNS